MSVRYAYHDRDADIASLATGESENVLSEEVNWVRGYPAGPAPLDTAEDAGRCTPGGVQGMWLTPG
jgi:hypothetical protein